MFLSRDPVEGVLNRPMSLNGYSYVEGNPVNRVDPSGKVWWLPFLLLSALAASTVLKLADVVHQVDVRTRFEGKSLETAWNELDLDSIQRNGRIGTVIGFLNAGAWLIGGSVGISGLIGGELEWARQYGVNLAKGMDIFHAGSRENINGWQIVEASAFSALTSGLWQGAKVLKAFAEEGIGALSSSLAFSQMTSSVAAATFWGGVMSAGSYVGSLLYVNNRRGNNPSNDFTWGDFFAASAAGSALNWITANIGKAFTPKFSLNPVFDRVAKGVGYFGAGLSIGIGQSSATSLFNSLAGTATVDWECGFRVSGFTGFANLSSYINSPIHYAFTSFLLGITVNEKGLELCSSTTSRNP